MADVNPTNQGDFAAAEKRDRGRPRGSKNKPKSSLDVVASSSTLAKHRPGRPLGSKNKKSAIVTADSADRLDVSSARPSAPSSSSGDKGIDYLLNCC
jgi:hypothetical protein